MLTAVKQAFKTLFTNTGTLYQRTIRGGIWVSASFAVGKSLSTIQQIVLARLLIPEDFGIYGLSLLAIASLEIFTQTGIKPALVQAKNLDNDTLNTAWTFSIIRNLILFLGLQALAPAASWFFNAPEIEPILRLLAFYVLLEGFVNIGTVFFQKNLEFQKLAVLDQVFIFSNFALSIVLAIIYQSVWAMVFARVISSLVLLIASFIVCPYRPRLCMNKHAAGRLFNFGKHVLVSEILLFGFRQGDDLIVGKLLGDVAVGFYMVAYNLASTPHSSITQIVSRVSFPVYSKLQNNLDELKDTYCKNLKLTATLALPLGLGLLLLAEDVVPILYGSKWTPMVPSVQVLCVYGLIRVLGATTSPVFQAMGRPGIISQLFGIKVFVLVLIIFPLTNTYDILGTSIAVTIAIFFGDLISYVRVSRLLKLSLFTPLRNIFPAVCAGLLMGFCVALSRRMFDLELGFFSLGILIAIGGITFTLAILVFDRATVREIFRTFKK